MGWAVRGLVGGRTIAVEADGEEGEDGLDDAQGEVEVEHLCGPVGLMCMVIGYSVVRCGSGSCC